MKVRLLDIAHARSGDKGDTANVGVIALKPDWYPVLVREVTRERVKKHFSGMITGDVQRFELPNLRAVAFNGRRSAAIGRAQLVQSALELIDLPSSL